MTTWTALTHVAGRVRAEALQNHVDEMVEPAPYGSGIFEIEDGSDRWEVGFYFTESPDEISLALLAAAYEATPFSVSELPELDWVAHVRRELTPVEAGRFFVYGSHDADQVPEDAEGLRIDAAMAFGTGHHGTTKGCLEAIDQLADDPDFQPERVVDIGCGTGVLAMAAARVWPHMVLASDNDSMAVDTARANVLANGLAGRVEVLEADAFNHPVLEDNAPYDLITANILMEPLISLAPDMAQMARAGGVVILSGLLSWQAKDTLAAYTDAGFSLRWQDELDEWATLVLERRADV